ncbi:MAG: 4-hydroxy-tetrahydrodipicolinate synthase family protein [Burkholderiaceae bacterium]
MRQDIDFSGVWIPIVTPFRDGKVDEPALAALTRRLDGQGIAGFIVCATTGEAPLLDDVERDRVLATVTAHATRPVVLGTSGSTAAQVLRKMDAAARHGPAAFLVTAPPYLKPSQDALRVFFTQVADAAPAPVMLYDIPSRTGVRLELETVLALAAHPRVVAIKDCGGRAEQTEALVIDGRLKVLCGNDAEWFASRCLGGDGAVAASAHVRTDLFVAFDRAMARGDLVRGRELWRQLRPLTVGFFDEPSPAPVKAVLAEAGECSDEVRAPLTAASAALRARLADLVARLPGAET